MNDYILLIYPVTLIIIAFTGCTYYKSGSFSDELWDKNQAKMLQAVACIGVILHHVSQLVTAYGSLWRGPITLISTSGFLITAIFFFFSGYGIVYNAINNPKYLDNFTTHRLPIILVPFFVSNIIYVLYITRFMGLSISVSKIIQCLLGLRLINGNGWYIVELFILYLIFYFIFKNVKNKDAAIVLFCLTTIGLIYYSYTKGHDLQPDFTMSWFKGEWWFNSTSTFIMGIIFARFRDPIISFFKRHYKLLLAITSVLYIIAFIIEEKILRICGYYQESLTISRFSNKAITLTAQTVLCIFSTLLILLINMKISIKNKVLKYISAISVEIFLIHNLFVDGVIDHSKLSFMSSFAVVLVCSLIAASLMHVIDFIILKIIAKIFDIKKIGLKKFAKNLLTKLVENFSKKDKKKLAFFAGIILVSFIIAANVFSLVYANIEINKVRSAEVGDIVELGKYRTEMYSFKKSKLAWRVLYKDDKKIILITEKGIVGSSYSTKHQETTWEESDLRTFLNSNLYNSIFNNKEKHYIITNSQTKDNLSLLTTSEALTYFSDDVDRETKITIAAEKTTYVNSYSKVQHWDEKGYRSSWWWLRGEESSLYAPIVTVDGTIEKDAQYVNKPRGAVRPVVWIKSN